MPRNWSPYIQTLSHSTEVRELAASPNERLVATADADAVVRIWDAVTGTERYTFPQESDYWVKELAFSTDGRQLVAIYETKDDWRFHSRFWNTMTGYEQPSLIRESAVECIAFSADSRVFAIGTAEGTISILDSTTMAQHHDFQCDTEAVAQIVFSPNGNYLASSSVPRPSILELTNRHISKTTIRLWEIATGRELCVLKNGESSPLTFSPNSKFLVYKADTRKICLWDIKNGRGFWCALCYIFYLKMIITVCK